MLHSIDVAADLEEELMSKSKSHPSVKGKRTWVAIKMTALLPDARALIALSSFIVESRKKDHRSPAKHAAIPFPGSPRIEDLDVILKMPSAIGQLTPAQVSGVWELYDDLVRICTYARERGIKVIVDAEYRYV
jgi:proline dehydrogenase